MRQPPLPERLRQCQITESQNAFAIGDDNNVYHCVGTIPQDFDDRIAQRVGNKEPMGPASD